MEKQHRERRGLGMKRKEEKAHNTLKPSKRHTMALPIFDKESKSLSSEGVEYLDPGRARDSGVLQSFPPSA